MNCLERSTLLDFLPISGPVLLLADEDDTTFLLALRSKFANELRLSECGCVSFGCSAEIGVGTVLTAGLGG
jgi:hypothetical protein